MKSCIEGRSAFDIGSKESEVDVKVGDKLQQAFSRLVVEKFAGIIT